jgi:acetylornithine deacetylase/succinyl-diaminopimelate desuccinylase-like protein
MRPNEPSVIAAGGELIVRAGRLHEAVAQRKHPIAGNESVFIGQVHSGEIFNQYPQECLVEGTRRWLPGTRRVDVENQLHGLFDQLATDTQTQVDRKLTLMRDAFELKQDDVVAAFQDAHQAIAGAPLPTGAKPFCDDGNSFWALARIAAITHGPRAGGAHTLDEWVSIRDLVRVALVYAATAVAYCGAAG